jgi:4-amino-4-deoxychorismate mutase
MSLDAAERARGIASPKDAARVDTPRVEALERLRSKLGAIDELLLDQLRQRLECCVEIALVKKAHGIPMMQPHRIDAAQDRATRYGNEHGISQDFLRRLYDVIIAETCRLEDLVIEADSDEEIL